MLFFEISAFASDVFVSKNRPKGHGIWLFLVMESHEKSWNLNFQKSMNPVLGPGFVRKKLNLHACMLLHDIVLQSCKQYRSELMTQAIMPEIKAWKLPRDSYRFHSGRLFGTSKSAKHTIGITKGGEVGNHVTTQREHPWWRIAVVKDASEIVWGWSLNSATYPRTNVVANRGSEGRFWNRVRLEPKQRHLSSN